MVAMATGGAPPAAQDHAQPWVEKYRPKTVEDVVHQEEVVSALKRALEGKDLPHMIFYGPPGTGKTTTALAISRQLFGPELVKQRLLELNASDERGIGVVREKIKTFAAASVGMGVQGYPCPPFKVIVLDESDFMTKDAQSALRRIIEQYSKTTRFVFCCNYITRIIEPLTSRCAKFRFKPIRSESMSARIEHICKHEQIALAPGAMDTLAAVAAGDMRKAITLLQSASKFEGSPVSSETLNEVAGEVPAEEIRSLLDSCSTCTFTDIQERVRAMICSSYPIGQVLIQLQKEVTCADVDDAIKANICVKLSSTDRCIVDGADEELQLLDAVGFVHQAIKGN